MFDQRILNIVSRYFKAPVETIDINTHFKNDLNADSIDMVELSIEIEKEFNLYINDEDIEKLYVVGDVIQYIPEQQLAAA